MATSNGRSVDLNSTLIYLFECPCCLETIIPPIYQCKNGHNVCSVCNSKLAQCPTCTAEMTNTRNMFAENIAQLLEFPCTNCERGCNELQLSIDKKLKHEQTCPYRLMTCIAGIKEHGQDDMKPCGWNGPYCELYGHVKQIHPDCMIYGNEIESVSQSNQLPKNDRTDLISVNGELFWRIFTADETTRKTFEFFKYIGSTEDAQKFFYEHSYSSQKWVWPITITNPVFSVLEDNEDIIKNNRCFVVDTQFVKYICSRYGPSFDSWKIKIKKV